MEAWYLMRNKIKKIYYTLLSGDLKATLYTCMCSCLVGLEACKDPGILSGGGGGVQVQLTEKSSDVFFLFF